GEIHGGKQNCILREGRLPGKRHCCYKADFRFAWYAGIEKARISGGNFRCSAAYITVVWGWFESLPDRRISPPSGRSLACLCPACWMRLSMLRFATSAQWSVLGLLACLPLVQAETPAPTRLALQPPVLELRGPQSRHGILVTALAEDGGQTDVTTGAK